MGTARRVPDVSLSISSDDSGVNVVGSDYPACSGRHAKLLPVKSPKACGTGHSGQGRVAGAGVDGVDDTAASMSGSEYERGK